MVDAGTIDHSVRIEGAIPGGRRLSVDFNWNGERLPGILLLPDAVSQAPAALLLHGFTLDKERMANSAGRALLSRGVASLSLDLPLHGERFQVFNPASLRTPIELVRRWRGALQESSLALRYLSLHPRIDAERIGMVGYSLGGYLGLKVATAEPSIRTVVLAAAGDLPDYVPFVKVARSLADPVKLVRQLSGRPLLMLHGRWDRTVPPAQAERLFEAAGEPKTMRWWDSGHVLPPAAIDDAADWLAGNLYGL
jgi:fermentation-respiration switch protein FrsA (DUF1100 family)